MNTAQQQMREAVADWNRSTITYRLPPEVLAACFSFLSLEQLFVATHVSQAWRATALSCPALWRVVTFEPGRFTDPDAVETVLKRSGQMPIDLVFGYASNEELLGRVLERHMHRVRRLRWPSQATDFLLQPAPLLESLTCDNLHPIRGDFLGGSAGRLHTLRLYYLLLPARCPALSTVTLLSFDLGGDEEDAESLVHLFSVCPVLEELEIGGLTERHEQYLLVHAPTRLQKLMLRSANNSLVDVARYVHAWGPANASLCTISLQMHYAYTPSHSASLLEDVETLSVSHHAYHDTMEVTSTRGRTCAVHLRHPWAFDCETISNKLATIIGPHGALLTQLRALSAPVTVLVRLFTPAPAMPALRTLTLLVQAKERETRNSRDHEGTIFPAAQVSCLAQTGHLQLTRIDIVALIDRVMIYESDVQTFLTTLATSLPARQQSEGVEVVLHGLHNELTADALPRVQGYRISLGEATG
ncbi:hypothetical protein AURDEDRAFT_164222 [Auricularia subglabra TFB-10046 SS5]|nr:hypothetical protein AURDEDRAFT_164222 [Auricularia subglabra TFB-10046 SS5]